MVDPIDVKWKGSASVGYWVNYVTLTLDLTHDIVLVFFKSNFEIFVSQELLVDVKQNKANLRDLIIATGLVILLKLDSNRPFFSRETPNLRQNQRFF